MLGFPWSLPVLGFTTVGISPGRVRRGLNKARVTETSYQGSYCWPVPQDRARALWPSSIPAHPLLNEPRAYSLVHLHRKAKTMCWNVNFITTTFCPGTQRLASICQLKCKPLYPLSRYLLVFPQRTSTRWTAHNSWFSPKSLSVPNKWHFCASTSYLLPLSLSTASKSLLKTYLQKASFWLNPSGIRSILHIWTSGQGKEAQKSASWGFWKEHGIRNEPQCLVAMIHVTWSK